MTQNNPTEGNSELIDLRLGIDGEVYESAGEAVRTQISWVLESVGVLDQYLDDINGEVI